jgi:proteic killer suppression protein
VLSCCKYLNQRKELQLAFESKSLRAICESEVEARLKLGERVAGALKHRIADLQAAISVKDLVAGRPEVVDESKGKEMAINLCDGQRLIFTANHAKYPKGEDNNLDWTRVSRIKLVRIEGHHV